MRYLLFLRYRAARNGLRALSGSGRFRILAGAILLLAVAAGLFWGFYRAFFFLQTFLGLGQILIERLLYLFTFTLFTLLIFSNTIISFQLHFKARETAYLHTLPLPPATLYRFLLLESAILSTGAAVFFLFPVALAYSLTHTVPFSALGLLFLFAAGLAALAALLGALLASQVPRVLVSGIGRRILIVAAVLIVIALPFRRFLTPREEAADRPTLMINQLLEHSRITLSPVFPGYWAAQGFIEAGRGRTRSGWGFLAVLAVNILLFREILQRTGGKFYFQTWSTYQSQGGAERKARKTSLSHPGRKPRPGRLLPVLIPSPVRALLTKDRKTFFRDPAQWLQAAILGGLLAVYIVNIRHMPKEVGEPFWKNLITVFNLGAASLILATLTTRFIFPAFSLEGKTFWILGLAPISRKTIFRTRFWGSYAVALLLTGPLILLSNRILEVSPEMTAVTVGVMVLVCGVLVSLATGLGAIFPDYNADNPARIASGFGGTVNLVLSLAYVGVIAGLLGLIGHLRSGLGGPGGAGAAGWAAGAILIISLAGIYLPYRLGNQALLKTEF